MESVREVIEKIKTDERRRNFFKDKLKQDLKRYSISCDEETLDKYFIEAVNTFNGDLPIQISPHIFNYVKEKSEKKERKYPKNKLFSETEMTIIEQYLEKKENGYYRTSEEIARNLGISITEVTQTIYKFNHQLNSNSNQMMKIFGNTESILRERKRKIQPSKKQANCKEALSNEDIELIGMFTGQVNDICLDIEELASMKNTTPQKMLERLRNVYELLNHEENYLKVIGKYPSINNMLKIKCASLGIPIPLMSITNDNPVVEGANFFKTMYEKDKNGEYLKPRDVAKKLGYSKFSTFSSRRITLLKELENDEDFKRKVLEKYPTLLEDKEQYEKGKSSKEITSTGDKKTQSQEEKNEEDVKVLKYFLKPLEDGMYRSPSEIAELLDITKFSVHRKMRRLLTKLEDKNYKALILEKYPELEEDIEKRMNQPKVQKIDNDVKVLKYFFKPLENGQYRSTSEMVKLLDITKSSVHRKKRVLLTKLEDKNYKALILEKYPELEEDIEKRNNQPKTKRKDNPKKIDNDVKVLKYFFKPLENGKYRSISEIAELLGKTTSSAYTKKWKLLTKLEDENYKTLILQQYPELEEDIEKRNNQPKTKRKDNPKKIDKDVKTLEYFFKPKDDGSYLSNSEIAKLLNIKEQSIYSTKKVLLTKLEDDNYKALVLQQYPELEEDIEKRNNQPKTKRKDNPKKIDDDVKDLKYFFKPLENGQYRSISEIGKLLDIIETSVCRKKRKLLTKLEDETYKALILEKYPELDDDIEKRNNQPKTKKKNNPKKIDKDVKTLEYFFKPKDGGSYLSNSEIAKLLNIKKNSIYQTKKNILTRLEESVEYKVLILEKYPELYDDIEKRNNQPKSLTIQETKLADLILTDETRKIEKNISYAKNLGIYPYQFSSLKDRVISKIKNNPNIRVSYPHFEVENEIFSSYRKGNSVTISQQELENIKRNSRKYDISHTEQNSKDGLIKGIQLLEKSKYRDYVSLCTTEQKAILALRLGYFNHTSFSTKDVSDMFGVEPEEIVLLTRECLKSGKSQSPNTHHIQKTKGTI